MTHPNSAEARARADALISTRESIMPPAGSPMRDAFLDLMLTFSAEQNPLPLAARASRIRTLADMMLIEMQIVGRQMGWAIAAHGSFSRDLDVIAVPWTDKAAYERAFVEAMRAAVARVIHGECYLADKEVTIKPNGRRSWVLHGNSPQLVEDEGGAHPYVDLAVMDFRLSVAGQAFGDGVYAACSALENTDRMADDLIASAWPDYADSYALALAPATTAVGWQDIASAPKDGTKFLAWLRGGEWPDVLFWESYDPEDQEEIGEEGYFTYAEELLANATDPIEISKYSHWATLPVHPIGGGSRG